MTLPAGLILAGGRGQRLGGTDKALVSLAGRPLLAHVLDRFRPQVGALALSANGDPARFAAFGLPVLADAPHGGEGGGEGPVAGLLAGLAWAEAAGHARLATVPVDLPFLPADLVTRLAEAPPDRPAIAVSATGRHPTCALWPVLFRRQIEQGLAQGERRLGMHAKDLAVTEIMFEDSSLDPFFNINTPRDLALAEGRFARGGP